MIVKDGGTDRGRLDLAAALRRLRSGARGRPMVRTALAGLILGFGGVTAGTGLVHASERGGLFDLFGAFFAPQVQQAEVPRLEPRRPRRYSSLPDARRVTAVRPRAVSPRPIALAQTRRVRQDRAPMAVIAPEAAATGPRTVCVRTCDGYLFPLGTLRTQQDVPVHQAACAAACPGAPTALYTLSAGQSELDQAVSLKGSPYLAAAWANVYRQRRVQNCQCRDSGLATMPLPVGSDPTLRVGDVVATDGSADVVTRMSRGDVKVEDYRTSRTLSRGTRTAIDTRVGALRRDADERAFQRALRTADAGPARVAEAHYARIRLGAADGDIESVAEPAGSRAPGFAPVRVLVPSPFKL